MNHVYIISELCGQWGGSKSRIEQMIFQSKMNGADAVKVQLYDTYRMAGDNREKWDYLTIDKDLFKSLHSFSRRLNLDFFASAFHEDRFEWIQEENLSINKIASCLLKQDFSLCEKMVKTGMQTFCSLGAWENKELPFQAKNVVYMHCLPKYPHLADEAIEHMPEKFDGKLLGYSDHSIGIDACIEAVKRGAKYIEKHFSICHELQSDTEGAHSCSMVSKELQMMRIAFEKITR